MPGKTRPEIPERERLTIERREKSEKLRLSALEVKSLKLCKLGPRFILITN